MAKCCLWWEKKEQEHEAGNEKVQCQQKTNKGIRVKNCSLNLDHIFYKLEKKSNYSLSTFHSNKRGKINFLIPSN